MPKKKTNRLGHLFSDFIRSFELTGKVDSNWLGAELAIPIRDKTVYINYVFSDSDDYYEYGAVLVDLKGHDIPSFSESLLRGDAIGGLTERITHDNKLYVSGMRNGLSGWQDEDVKYGYMDDLARVASAYEQFRHKSGR